MTTRSGSARPPATSARRRVIRARGSTEKRFSGFGSFLSELYPSAVRGTGQGFTYNTGRAVGAVFPTTVGFLADSWGVGGALVFGALGYGLAAAALLGLPETRGKELV